MAYTVPEKLVWSILVSLGTMSVLTWTLVPAAARAQLDTISDCLGLPCGDTPVALIDRIETFVSAAMSLISMIAVMFLVYAGYKYITSAGNEEAAAQAKRQIIYAIIGLAIVIANTARVFIFPAIDKVARGDPSSAVALSVIADQYIRGALFLIGTVATIYLIYAGYKYISSRGDYEASETAKRQIVYALVGIVVAAGARIIVDAVISPAAGAGQRLENLVRPSVNATLALAGVAAAAYMVMAGVMYFSAEGDEQQAEAAKRQLIYAVIGIAVIMLSAAIVNFIILAVT